jgi:hypothetical protein
MSGNLPAFTGRALQRGRVCLRRVFRRGVLGQFRQLAPQRLEVLRPLCWVAR